MQPSTKADKNGILCSAFTKVSIACRIGLLLASTFRNLVIHVNDGAKCDKLLASRPREPSLDFCERCVRQGNHVSLLSFLLNRMIEFAPALEMAWATWDFLLPLDWVVPFAGGKKNGLISLVWSMGSKLEIPADNPPADMREMYVWSIVCTAIKAIPDGVAMMKSGVEAKWGTIGRVKLQAVKLCKGCEARC